MKLLVGYNGSVASQNALALACNDAAKFDGFVFVVSSKEGGGSENEETVRQVAEILEGAEHILSDHGIPGECVQLVRGMTPGEDIVKFAEDNAIDQIYIGIEKTSRTRKILLGSTAQYVILKGPCPVTTTR
jgi:nucleotide-binding universal stress UspA family protein